MARSNVIDVSAFVRLFESWKENEHLTLKELRLKVVALPGLALMLRPSDVAPQAQSFDAEFNITSRFVMSTDQLVFLPDGALQVTFFWDKERHPAKWLRRNSSGRGQHSGRPSECFAYLHHAYGFHEVPG